MSTFDLTQKVKIVNPNASSDSQYGPYNSIGEALTATENLRELGRTVGIIDSGIITEYWFKEGITDEDLILKTTGSNGSGQFFKEITKDGDFTAEKITSGVDDGKYRFKIKGDETLEWTIGDTNYVYNLDSNDEWTFIADALGLGVERRIDAVSYGNDGQIYYWKGTETGQASYPNVPETHILKSFVTITEDGVLIEDGGFVTKQSEHWTLSQNTTNGNISLPVVINGNLRNRKFQANFGAGTFTIGRLDVGGGGGFYPFTPIWDGMTVSFTNIGLNDITVKHYDISHPILPQTYRILLPNSKDIILKTGETITLILDMTSGVFRLYSLGKEFNGSSVLTSDDNTLYIEDGVIRLNVTDITEEFIANGVDRNFEMTNVYTSIENVFINGVRIKSSDYITISEQEIEIKTTVTLLLGDEVVIQGTMFVVE